MDTEIKIPDIAVYSSLTINITMYIGIVYSTVYKTRVDKLIHIKQIYYLIRQNILLYI